MVRLPSSSGSFVTRGLLQGRLRPKKPRLVIELVIELRYLKPTNQP
jgi:hypothetical protein